MDIKTFATNILHCSYSLWRFTIRGERNLSYKKAKLVSGLLNTSVDVWLDPSFKSERKTAWENYQARFQK